MQTRIRVLVADDNAALRESLRYGFQGTEIEIVAEAATGQQAALAAREHELDLALLDISMPEGDGLQALEWIRAERPALPVLMFSLHKSRDQVLRARELGAAGYLIKGYSLSTLLYGIRAAACGEDIWHLAPDLNRPAEQVGGGPKRT